MSSAELRWPVTIFEADGWPNIVDVPEDVAGLYEDEFWDEVRFAFDSELSPVVVAVDDESNYSLVRTASPPQPKAFSELALHALMHFDDKRACRWRKAGFERATELAGWDAPSLWRELMLKFRGR